jgi:hypothetical protein
MIETGKNGEVSRNWTKRMVSQALDSGAWPRAARAHWSEALTIQTLFEMSMLEGASA